MQLQIPVCSMKVLFQLSTNSILWLVIGNAKVRLFEEKKRYTYFNAGFVEDGWLTCQDNELLSNIKDSRKYEVCNGQLY